MFHADSEISRIGSSAGTRPVRVCEDTLSILRRAKELSRRCGGRFDVSAAPLTELWRTAAHKGCPPEEHTVMRRAALVDWNSLELDKRGFAYQPRTGQRIDLGGIGKGFAADRVKEVYRRHGVTSGLINLGGNVMVIGSRTDGLDWRVGVRDPDVGHTALAGYVDVRNSAVVSSGGYEDYFEYRGTRYQHILDPATGWPADTDVRSVTVVTASATDADAYATAVCVMGLKAGLEFLEQLPDVEGLIMDSRGAMNATEGLRERFTAASLTSKRRMATLTPLMSHRGRASMNRSELGRHVSGDMDRKSSAHDVLLVGAGPAGLAAAVHFREAGLDVLHVEEGKPAQTIRRFPAGVRLFSNRASLALPGLPFGPDPEASPTREEYIAYLEESAAAAGLRVETGTTAVAAEAVRGRYRVDLRGPDGVRRVVEACSVVVASGGYFFPNILGIPGEDHPHVHHYFRGEIVSPEELMVVVGGRNSAIEAAVNIAEIGAEALLVYRKSRLPRSKIKPWLLPRLDRQIRAGRIHVHYRSVPLEVTPLGVVLREADGSSQLQPADAVFLLTGYGPDYRLLRGAGIRFHQRTARPLFTEATLETRSPGVFLCGTVALRVGREDATIENSRDHALLMLDSIRARCRAE